MSGDVLLTAPSRNSAGGAGENPRPQGCQTAFIKLLANKEGFLPSGSMLKKKTRGRYRNTPRDQKRDEAGRHPYRSTPLEHTAALRPGEPTAAPSPHTNTGEKVVPQSKKQQLTFWVLKPRRRATSGAFKLKAVAGSTGRRAHQEHAGPKAPLLLHCPEEKAHQEHRHRGQSFVVARLEEAKPHF